MLSALKKIFLFILLSKSYLSYAHSNDRESFYKGLRYFNEEQYSTARIHFIEFIKHSDNFNANVIDAEYYNALCSLILKLPNSDKIFNNFVKKYQNHNNTYKVYFHLGNMKFASGDFASSIEYYNKVNPSKIDLYAKHKLFFCLGYSYLNEKNLERALEYFSKIKISNNNYMHLANYYSGYILIKQEKYDLALKDLRKTSENEEYKSVIPYLIAYIYYKKNDYDKLIEYVKNIYKHNVTLKNQDVVELLLAESYRNRSDYTKAAKHYDNYVFFKENKTDRDALLRNAYCLILAKDIGGATKILETLAILDDKIAFIASYLLGKLYLRKSCKEDAILAFEKAGHSTTKSDINEEATFIYSKLNFDLGRHLIAIDSFKQLKNQYPDTKFHKEISSFLGSLYLHTSNFDLAIKQVEKERNRSPKMLHVFQKGTFLKGNEYFNNGEYGKAISMYEKSLTAPKNKKIEILTYNWLGDTFSAVKNYNKAIKSYEKFIKNNVLGLKENNSSINTNTKVMTYYGRAFAHFKLREYSIALKYFNLAYHNIEQIKKIKIINHSIEGEMHQFSDVIKVKSDIELRIADCNYFLNDYRKSIEFYDKYLTKNSKNLHANLQKGVIYELLGKNSLAEKCFKSVIKIGKHDDLVYYDEAKFRYANTAFRKGNYKLSIKRFKEFVVERYHSKYTPLCLLKEIICHINLNQISQAIKTCSIIINNFPKTQEAYYALLELQKIADNSIYQKYFEEYKKSNPDKKSLESLEFESAKTSFYNHRFEDAIKVSLKYIADYPTSYNIKEIYYLLAQSYFKLKDLSKATDFYHKAIKDENVPFFNKALLKLARLEYLSEDYNNSIKHFKILEKFAKHKKEKLFATQGIMQCSYKLKAYTECLSYINTILSKNIIPSIVYEARLFKAKCYMRQAKKDLAKKELRSIIQDSNSIYAAEACYIIAKDLHNCNKHEQSLEQLFKLTRNYIGYNTWINKAFILIADNYISLDKKFQAKATLESILNKSKDEQTISEAKNRMELLNKAIDKELDKPQKKLVIKNSAM